MANLASGEKGLVSVVGPSLVKGLSKLTPEGDSIWVIGESSPCFVRFITVVFIESRRTKSGLFLRDSKADLFFISDTGILLARMESNSSSGEFVMLSFNVIMFEVCSFVI